jgi:hypothetical protein
VVDRIHHPVIQKQYGYRFLPLHPHQKTNLQPISFPSLQNNETATGIVSPSYSLEIDFDDPHAHESGIISKPSDQGLSTKNLEHKAVEIKEGPEDLVFNFQPEPTTNTTQGYIKENSPSFPPLQIFKFPPRLPIEQYASSQVQQSSLTIQTSPPIPPAQTCGWSSTSSTNTVHIYSNACPSCS